MTWEAILHWSGNVFLVAGVFFTLVGSIGLHRFPDFYTRAHAATKPDTLGLTLIMFGLAIQRGFDLQSAKLVFITLIVAFTNPAAAHALGRSALRAGLAPWTTGADGPAGSATPPGGKPAAGSSESEGESS